MKKIYLYSCVLAFICCNQANAGTSLLNITGKSLGLIERDFTLSGIASDLDGDAVPELLIRHSRPENLSQYISVFKTKTKLADELFSFDGNIGGWGATPFALWGSEFNGIFSFYDLNGAFHIHEHGKEDRVLRTDWLGIGQVEEVGDWNGDGIPDRLVLATVRGEMSRSLLGFS